MKKILIAIDYSPAATTVAEQGYALAKSMNASVVLLHVLQEVTYYASTSYNPIMGFGGFINTNLLDSNDINNIEKGATQYLEKIKEHLQDNTIEILVVHGQIADTIIETATKEHCHILVLGTHSRSGIEKLLLGNTASDLIKSATIPIYIIPIKA